MTQYDNRYPPVGAGVGAVAIDEGLRAYMSRVYNYMALGVAVTGLVAYFVFTQTTTADFALAAKLTNGAALLAKAAGKNDPALYFTPLGAAIFRTWLFWVLLLAPLGLSWWLSGSIHTMRPATAQIAFWAFSALVGVTLSIIFIRYTQGSIARALFMAAAVFGALSLYGYTTKRDLSGWGTFLFMGMIGAIVASFVSIFLAMYFQVPFPMLQFIISMVVLLVFAGFTAYDTQRIKEEYVYSGGAVGAMESMAISGALHLYISFLNIFQALLSLFGDRE
ncbi:MAG: Bax inhibitor-1/YccA family protein [Hyphomicrobiaceae bacterium]